MQAKIFTLFLALGIATISSAQVRVGPFLGYGSKLDLWGLGAHTEVAFNEKVSASVVFMQYFPEELNNAPRRSAWELNGNVNYYLVSGYRGYLYGLGGLNFTHVKRRSNTALGETTEKDPNVGINLGIGTMVRINDLIIPFAEGKYTVGGYTQPSLIVGVKFSLGDDDFDDDY